MSGAVLTNGPDLWRGLFPVPRADGYKYHRGHAVVVSGGIEMSGAARLAARAALRMGAGLVTVATPRSALLVQAMALDAVMVRAVDGASELAAFLSDKRRNAVLLGPGNGVGEGTRENVKAALQSGCAVVLDADALTSFEDEPEQCYASIRTSRCQAVLTPHEGEFSRLFKDINQKAESDSKLQRARAAACESGAIVVLKGPGTVVAAPDGRAAVAENATPWLATAGSGDVLAGMVLALLAQGMPAFEAACAAVWLHGQAGREVGPGLISEDLAPALRGVLKREIISTFSC